VGLALVALMVAGEASPCWGAEPAPAPPPAATGPRMPAVRPPMPGLMGELPDTPEIPPEKLPAQYFASLGQTHLQHAQWTKAEECYREAYGREHDAAARGEYACCLGQLLMRKQEYAKALPLIEEAVKNVPEASRSYQLRRYRTTLAALHERMGQPEKAEGIFLDWTRDPGGPFEAEVARRELLRFWQRTGKLDAAVAKYEAALKEKPTDKEALDMLRLVYTSVKPEPEKSLALAEKLAELQPDDRNAAMHLVGAYERAKKFDKAIALLEKLIAKHPEETSALSMQMAQLYIQSGQRDKAQDSARKMIEQGSESSGAHAQAASIYSQLNLVDAALAEYEAAAKLAKGDPERERYLLSAAHAAQRAKKFPKAEALARELSRSSSKATVGQAKRLLFDLYEEQNKLDQLEVKPGEK